jgi:hypothetical protein
MNPTWCGQDILIFEKRVNWSLGIPWEDDFDVVADPMAIFFWLWGSSNVNTRTFFSLFELLFVPSDKLDT